MSEKKIPAALDRIEGAVAVIELSDRTEAVPASLLPQGAREGMRLVVLISESGEICGIEADPDGTEEAHGRIAEKKSRLFRKFSPEADKIEDNGGQT